MRTSSLGIGLGMFLSLLLASVSVGSAQEVVGTWSVSVELGGAGGGDATIVLHQSGDALTGSYTGDLGEHQVTGTVLDGDIQFGFDVDQLGEVIYLGRLIGEQIEGRCAYGNLGSGTFVAKRSG
jgi:hypothetical protein